MNLRKWSHPRAPAVCIIDMIGGKLPEEVVGFT
jgi:hypothetical protein